MNKKLKTTKKSINKQDDTVSLRTTIDELCNLVCTLNKRVEELSKHVDEVDEVEKAIVHDLNGVDNQCRYMNKHFVRHINFMDVVKKQLLLLDKNIIFCPECGHTWKRLGNGMTPEELNLLCNGLNSTRDHIERVVDHEYCQEEVMAELKK